MSIPPPPAKLSPKPHPSTIPKGTILHRVWSGHPHRAANVFNPGIGDPTRFAPLDRPPGSPPGRRAGTLYAATSFEVAVYETVFRDLPPVPALRVIPRSRIATNAYATLTPQRDLILASLFDKHIRRWGLTRTQLIASTGRAAYAATVKWAEAIYDLDSYDGIVWSSRQDDSGHAFMLFGDRIRPDDLLVGPVMPFGHGPGKLAIEQLAFDHLIDIS